MSTKSVATFSPFYEKSGSPTGSHAINPLPSWSQHLTVALFSNSKPNVDHLFRGLVDGLQDAGLRNFMYLGKNAPSVGMDESTLTTIRARANLFITAMAD
jgi:hypothetical protein